MGAKEEGRRGESPLLYEIEDGNSVPYWREKLLAIGTEQKVALAVDSPQKVGKLRARC